MCCGNRQSPEGEQNGMNASLLKELEALQAAPLDTVRQMYRELLGEETRSRHRGFLLRRIAWQLQANAEGGLSERAHRRALEIANDADVRVLPPQEQFSTSLGRARFDRRIPAPGTILNRQYRSRMIT